MRADVFFFLIFVSCVVAKERGFLPVLEDKLEKKLTEYVEYFENWLKSFNDEHLGKTEIGRFLHYDEMKAKLVEAENPSESRRMKKMGSAMMPLIFHIGATSTWMLLTTVLTAKSLAVGLALLVFKIAVSSAKLASFFTNLKHSKHGRHDYSPAWIPQYDHHDHIEHHPEHHGTITHIPDWTPNGIPHLHEYKNVNDFKNTEFHDFKNNELHNFKNHDLHDFKNHELYSFNNNEFHDLQNNEIHNFVPHEINNYNTIPVHDIHGSSGSFQGDYNHYEGAMKKIDAKVG